MIVTRENFAEVLIKLETQRELALDTETTGLRPYHGHIPFAVIMHDGEQAYYFNFNEYPDQSDSERLTWAEHGAGLAPLLADLHRTWYFHNAKFDMAMLAGQGLPIAGKIHCTMTVARVIDSTLRPNQFGLDACAARIGYEKLDTVKAYLLANGLYTEEKSEGKKTKKKNFHYSLAPWDLIVPYGERDAEITWHLAKRQLRDLDEIAASMPAGLPTVKDVYENECKLVRTVFEMERRGVLIDREFCKRAIAQSEETLRTSAETFAQLTGIPFKDSGVTFKQAFAELKDKWVWGETTATGKRNPSFDSEVLVEFKHPAADAVVAWRQAKSDANYYHGFLHAADAGGVIHASFNQHVATHGRFSSSDPNLQNLTKNDDDEIEEQEFIVRRAIIPRPGMVFHMLDFDQMEYRLMLDYAARFAVDKEGVLALIAKVLGGLDVHQATAEVAACSRNEAKRTNFATIYGAGLAKLASSLKTTQARAKAIKDSIMKAAPEIGILIRRVMETAEKRGYIVNWFGRRCSFPDSQYAYCAPNYMIAGGSADIVKLAMNKIDAYLAPFQTRLVLMIHDELVLEGPPEEAERVIPEVRKIMETVYPARFVPLTCGVDHSHKSLADKIEGIANVK